MSSFPILDLVVGIIFIYFLLSIICSSAVELWFSIRNTRGRLLAQWLIRIFDTQALDSNGIPKIKNGKPVSVGQAIMDHCMVTALSKDGKSGSYMDAQNFVSALLDKITISPVKAGLNLVQLPPKNLDEYILAIEQSEVISGELKRTILSFANAAKTSGNVLKQIPTTSNIAIDFITTVKSEFDLFREKLENWYDTNQNRLTGTLKRKKVLPSTIIIATVITIGLNADSIAISKYLYDNKEVTKVFAEKALNSLNNYNERIEKMKNDTGVIKSREFETIVTLDTALNRVKNDIAIFKSTVPEGLPLGWTDKTVFNWNTILGWLATILAISLGAPFWFDILNKIANLRGTGPKPAGSNDSNKK